MFSIRTFCKSVTSKKDVEKLALSFSGCGFLGAYNFGAAKCLLNESDDLILNVKRIAGASAGSLIASLLVLAPEKVDAGIETLYKMADDVHSMPLGAMTPGYYINEKLVTVIDSFLPQDIAPAQGKLYVSLTKRKTWENVLISQFDNRDHLIAALLASCYIPMYSMGIKGATPEINEEVSCSLLPRYISIISFWEFMDGGVSNNLPVFDDMRTITCSPFSSIADICPDDVSYWNVTVGKQVFRVNGKNVGRGARALFPPTRHILKQYFDMGYLDAQKFLKSDKTSITH